MSKGQRTKTRIVEAASVLMNRQGWLTTPVSAVLTSTGLKKGGLYNHFDSMDDLAAQAFEHASGQLLAMVRHKLAEKNDPKDKLLNLLAAFNWVGKRNPPFESGCPILNAATEADDINEPMRQRVAGVAIEIIDELEAVIKAGCDNGTFRQGLNPRHAAQFMFASFEGGVMLAGLTKDAAMFSDIKQTIEAVIESWCTGKRSDP